MIAEAYQSLENFFNGNMLLAFAALCGIAGLIIVLIRKA